MTALSDPNTPKDAYTLSPVMAVRVAASVGRHLVVELPTLAGAIATDRIQIKPVAYQAQYLPDATWSEPAPTLLQSFLVESFQNMGGVRLVGRAGAGLMPDYTLMTEMMEFDAEPVGPSPTPRTIRIGVMMTQIDETITVSWHPAGSVQRQWFRRVTLPPSSGALAVLRCYCLTMSSCGPARRQDKPPAVHPPPSLTSISVSMRQKRYDEGSTGFPIRAFARRDRGLSPRWHEHPRKT